MVAPDALATVFLPRLTTPKSVMPETVTVVASETNGLPKQVDSVVMSESFSKQKRYSPGSTDTVEIPESLVPSSATRCQDLLASS